jgi:hypothetical protein
MTIAIETSSAYSAYYRHGGIMQYVPLRSLLRN